MPFFTGFSVEECSVFAIAVQCNLEPNVTASAQDTAVSKNSKSMICTCVLFYLCVFL